MRKVLCTNFSVDYLRFVKFTPQICESCGASYGRICEMFSVLQSTSRPLTEAENTIKCKTQI